jgi:hypothetical protein
MAGGKERDVWQYGDFQTPPDLAADICTRIANMGIEPTEIIEPTCGRGAFLEAAIPAFPAAASLLGVDINPDYIEEARVRIRATGCQRARVEPGDFFVTDWDHLVATGSGPLLVLGNPPWVTSSELGSLKSTNLPTKSNFQGHRGLDALTGKANFDISEWMLLQQIEWLRRRSGWIAMLVKTSVARKVLRQMWKSDKPVGQASIFKIDAMRHFGASVEACLFVLPIGINSPSNDCDVFDGLDEVEPKGTIGWHDGHLVSDVTAYTKHRELVGPNPERVWRSGVKHDCSKVMELTRDNDGALYNGLGERVKIEPDLLFPLLKSSDVAKGRPRGDRYMIVTQSKVGADTSEIATNAPETWAYLTDHGEQMDARGSVIYRGKPRFCIFGVGDYTFAPWKIAISGFYKSVRFSKFGPLEGNPVVFDDTVYFLPCWSEEEADLILTLVQSNPYRELLASMTFSGEKRPITTDLLRRISFEKVAASIGLLDELASYVSEAAHSAKTSIH